MCFLCHFLLNLLVTSTSLLLEFIGYDNKCELNFSQTYNGFTLCLVLCFTSLCSSFFFLFHKNHDVGKSVVNKGFLVRLVVALSVLDDREGFTNNAGYHRMFPWLKPFESTSTVASERGSHPLRDPRATLFGIGSV